MASSIKTRNFSFLPTEHLARHYAMKAAWLSLSVMTIALGPIIYLVIQNYFLFKDLAFQIAPVLVEHLEREVLFITTYVVAVSIAVSLFFVVLVGRVVHRFTGPLLKIERHMYEISKGNWSKMNLQLRQNDELKNFMRAYNYLCGSMKAHALYDLNELKRLETKEAALQNLIDKKQGLLKVAG